MICWYCHWGWAKPVADIYFEALRRVGEDSNALEYGPSHIVWCDENFEDSCIQNCLERFAEPMYSHYSAAELAVVRWSLEELLKLPEDARCIEPEEYNGENPENFPPTVEVVSKHAIDWMEAYRVLPSE